MNANRWGALIRRLAAMIPPVIALAACSGGGGGGGGADAPAPSPEVEGPSALDNEALSAAKTARGLTGDPAAARGARQRLPDDDALVKLGQLLSQFNPKPQGTDSDRSAFRTPSLLNVAETAPYGHAGSFATLEAVLAYHADPRSAVETFDFILADLAQFRSSGVAYAHAQPHTRAAIEASSFAAVEPMLPSRPLLAHELARLVAFLESLTDRCVRSASCIGQWTPAIDEDPDGHMLMRDVSAGTPGNLDASSPDDYPTEISMTFPQTAPLATFPDVEGCTDTLAANDNTGDTTFTRQTGPSFGLTHARFDYDRDGDVDIAVLHHSAGLQFFDNRSGSDQGRSFMSIRLVGSAPNTDAIGAEVFVTLTWATASACRLR